VQFEYPWALGPADGRYVVREAGAEAPAEVLVLATLGAPERRRLRARRPREVPSEPPPAPVTTARATVVDVQPVATAEARAWLAGADRAVAERALATLARAVRAHRLASADPAVREPALAQALVVRAGYGAGEEVAQGRWSAARELPVEPPKGRRSALLRPQERLAALLGGRARALACEELALRARDDLDRGRPREAALQLRAALDAALAELPPVAASAGQSRRLAELRELRELRPALDALAEAALAGDAPSSAAAEQLARTLGRVEAALRAHADDQINARVEP